MVGLTDAQLAIMRAQVERMLPGTVVIQSVTEVSDGAGGWTEAWAAVAGGTVSARVDPVTQRQAIELNIAQEQIEDLRQLTVSWDAPLGEGERVLYESEAWEIVSRVADHSWNVSRRAVIMRSS